MKKAIVIISLFLVVFLWQYSQVRKTTIAYFDKKGTVQTLSLPVKDKQKLNNLMETLFIWDNFAYAILGNKPVSWANYTSPLPYTNWKNFKDSWGEYNRTLRNGWKTWEKYKHLFPKAPIRVEHPSCYSNSSSILIINKNMFNQVVLSNKSEFESLLQKPISNGFQLLEESKKGSLMNDVLGGHQILLGIVLGYGKENAKLFQKSCEIRKPGSWIWEGDRDENLLRNHGPIPENMTEKEFCMYEYGLPSFIGNPHSEESNALKKDYLRTREVIAEYYKGKDFLEATLSLLAGHRPKGL